MLASWDKLWWASLHPQEFQIILVWAKRVLTVFTGQPWVAVFLFRTPLFLCKWMRCIPQSLHLPEKREPQHVLRLWAHTPCVSTTGSKPCHHGRAGPAALDPAKAASSLFCSVSHAANVFTSLSWFHVRHPQCDRQPHVVCYQHSWETLLRGKGMEAT